MYTRAKIEKLLETLDGIIVDVRSLITDGCPSINNLGEEYHIDSMKKLLEKLKKYRHDIQAQYDADTLAASSKNSN